MEAPIQMEQGVMLYDTKIHPHHRVQLARPEEVVACWQPLGPAVWFGKDPDFDRRFRETFAAEHAAAVEGRLFHWQLNAEGALALVLLLDQYPRNAFRDTARMYATDRLAVDVAKGALAAGFDAEVDPSLVLFFYLPFAHSEALDDQERSVALASRLPDPAPAHSRRHRDIVARFGRFPHRNMILGRVSTEEEIAWLADGGFAG
jgi:uncharacterized protein (DUF924 family)